MSSDRDAAERLGVTHRAFALAVLRAQRKRRTGEPMTELEREAWRVAVAVAPGTKVMALDA